MVPVVVRPVPVLVRVVVLVRVLVAVRPLVAGRRVGGPPVGVVAVLRPVALLVVVRPRRR